MLKINNFLEFFPQIVSSKLDFFFEQLGKVENIILKNKLNNIQKPIFICGQARSGTTALVETLNKHKDTGSFIYKDLPFIKTLYFWSLINNIYYKGVKSRPRSHGDGLEVSPESPDAIEELMWKNFLTDYENSGFFKILDDNYKNDKFEEYYRLQIKKILHIRGNKKRYLSKGNYNIFRLKYIKNIFPDAKLIICFRDPIETAISANNVHHNFINLSERNKYFDKSLINNCHFEFGKPRKSIDDIESNIERGNLEEKYYYYLNQWYKIYSIATKNYIDLKDVIFVNSQTMNENTNFINILLNRLELSNDLSSKVTFKKRSINNKINLSNFNHLNDLYKKLNYLEKTTLFANE